ncbi:MAG: peptidylprolyl isomerase [Patescibacteria group bacterium]
MVGLNTKYGQIVIKLYKKDAPNSVANFIKKIESGYYDGLTFHRVEADFVVQGGDPLGNGTGGGDQKSEINSIPFVKGSVGLARGPVKEISNDSQFFICLTSENCQSLTGDYVNIGEVVSGMDFVSKIKVGDKILQFTDKTK